MSGLSCAKKITLNGVKVPFSRVQVYALGPSGVRRVRHRSQLPQDALGAGVWVVTASAGETAPDTSVINQALRTGDGSALPQGWSLATSHSPRKDAPGASTSRRRTAEGGSGYARTLKSELRALAVAGASAETFYETASNRAGRLRALTAALTKENPDQVAELVEDLVSRQRRRSAALAIAVEAAVAGHPSGWRLISAALNRPDDPGLALQYAQDNFGRIPRCVRVAAADAATRLYTDSSAARFNKSRSASVTGESTSQGFRFEDVIALCHPKPATAAQGELFAFLRGRAADPQQIPITTGLKRLAQATPEERTAAFDAARAWAREVYSGNRPAHDRPTDPVVLAIVSSEWRTLASFQTPQMQDPLRASALAEAREQVRLANIASKKARRAYLRAAAERGNEYDPEVSAARTQWQEAALTVKRAVRAKEQAARAARGTATAVIEAALPAMSYKDTLMVLSRLDNNEADPLAVEFAANRLRSVESMTGSSVGLADAVRAAKAVSEAAIARRRAEAATARRHELERARPVDTGSMLVYSSHSQQHEDLNSSWDYVESWVHVETQFDEVLGDVTTALVGDTLAPLAGRRVLVLVDGSGSMTEKVSTRPTDPRSTVFSGLSRDEVAAFTAAAIATAPGVAADVVAYDTSGYAVDLTSAGNAVAATRKIVEQCPGGGTDTWRVALDSWDDHDLVVILTDEQTSWTPDEEFTNSNSWYGETNAAPTRSKLPSHVQVVTCNLGGFGTAHGRVGDQMVELCGATEALFEELAAAATFGK